MNQVQQFLTGAGITWSACTEDVMRVARHAVKEREELVGLVREARKIVRASSSRNLVKDWDRRATAALGKVPT